MKMSDCQSGNGGGYGGWGVASLTLGGLTTLTGEKDNYKKEGNMR